jgi:hypothetical protein
VTADNLPARFRVGALYSFFILPYRHGHAETAQRELATVMSRPGKSTRPDYSVRCKLRRETAALQTCPLKRPVSSRQMPARAL